MAQVKKIKTKQKAPAKRRAPRKQGPSFYQQLTTGDWLGRSSEDYTYKKEGKSTGWEASLVKGEAFSRFILKVPNGKKPLPAQRQIMLAKMACNSILTVMNRAKKKVRLGFTPQLSSLQFGQYIQVSLEPLGSTLPFATYNHRLDVILGFCVHEIAHFLYTTTDYDRYVSRFTGIEQAMKAYFMNTLEDERIEGLVAKNFRGYGNYISKVKDYMFNERYKLEFEKHMKAMASQEHSREFSELVNCIFYLLRYPKALSEELVGKFEKELREVMTILTPFPDTHIKQGVAVDKIYEVLFRFMGKLLDEEKEALSNSMQQKQQAPRQQQQQGQGQKQPQPPQPGGKQQQQSDDEDGDGDDAGDQQGPPSIKQQSKAKAQNGGGNIKSDAQDGEAGEETDENAQSQGKPGKGKKGEREDSRSRGHDEEDYDDVPDDVDGESPAKKKAGNKDTGKKGVEADDDAGDDDSENTKGKSRGGKKQDADEGTEPRDGGSQLADKEETMAPEDEESEDGEGGGAGGSGSEDDSEPYEPQSDKGEIDRAIKEVADAVSKAVAGAMLKTGATAEDVAKNAKITKDGVEDFLRQISNMTAEELMEFSSCGHSFPHTENLDVNDMNVRFIPADKVTGVPQNVYDLTLASVRPHAASLRAKIQKLNRSHTYTQKGLAEGNFDEECLVDALMGGRNVYKLDTRITNRGAAVVYLGDESGSMAATDDKEARWFKSQQIAVLFERALDGVNNVDFFAYGHTTDGGGYNTFGRSMMDTDQDMVQLATHIHVYYEGRKKGNRKMLGNIFAHSANRDGHALLETVARVRSMVPMTQQIILFMVSDGEPTAPVPRPYNGVTYCKKVVDYVQKYQNCTVIHIAIAEDIPSEEMYTHYVKFVDFTTLVRDIGNLLTKIISKTQAPVEQILD